MVVTLTSKRQVTFPAAVLEKLGVKAGARLEIIPSPHGFLIRPQRVNDSMLAPLKGHIRGKIKPLNLEAFRSQSYDPSLRD